ncbi:hypothetical protein TKK_0017689 [Trichogramma kaykai]
MHCTTWSLRQYFWASSTLTTSWRAENLQTTVTTSHCNTPSHKLRSMHQRQLAYISQYTTSIKYLPGAENPVVDALSRIYDKKKLSLQETSTAAVSNSCVDAFALPTTFSLEELSEDQGKDDQLPIILADKKMPLPLQKGMWPINKRLVPIYYNTEGDLIHPYVPVAMRR